MFSKTYSDFKRTGYGSFKSETEDEEVDPQIAAHLLSTKEEAFNSSVTQNTFRSTFTRLSKQKKVEMPDIYGLRKDTPVDIFKPKDGQYQNLQFKPKMNLQKKQLYQPQSLQFVLRPRKIHVDEKKVEEQIIAGKKPSLKIFESKHNLKPLKSVYKFQVDENKWHDKIKPHRSQMNPMLLVSTPSEGKDDLDIKKAPVLFKSITPTPLKNEFIGTQLYSPDESKTLKAYDDETKTEEQLRKQFESNSQLKKEFSEFIRWQQHGNQPDFDNHPDFFQPDANLPYANQDNIMQIAKCLILTHRNSPSTLKDRNTVTMGRPGSEFLRVTRFRDALYFEDKVQSDKMVPWWNVMAKQEEKMQQTLKGSQSLKYSRLSKGLVSEYKPELKCVYPMKIAFIKNKQLDVNIKKMNLKKADYINQISSKHLVNNFYTDNKMSQQQKQGDNQSELGFEDLQNGIYVTAFPQ